MIFRAYRNRERDTCYGGVGVLRVNLASYSDPDNFDASTALGRCTRTDGSSDVETDLTRGVELHLLRELMTYACCSHRRELPLPARNSFEHRVECLRDELLQLNCADRPLAHHHFSCLAVNPARSSIARPALSTICSSSSLPMR